MKVKLFCSVLLLLFSAFPVRANLNSIRLLLADWSKLQSPFDLNGDQKVNTIGTVDLVGIRKTVRKTQKNYLVKFSGSILSQT